MKQRYRRGVITWEEALERILQQTLPLPGRRRPLREALDCFATEEIVARMALPPFDNSAMDGYAVIAGDCRAGERLRIVGEQPAGADRGLQVGRGEAVRILTGAPLPAGADAVVMQEDVTVENDKIVLREAIQPGEFVRRRGGDVAEGQRILERGVRISPQTIGLLAAQGFDGLEVGGKARVALISTGDELAPAGGALQPGQIYDSNSALLAALARRCGAEVVSEVHCPDRPEEIQAAVREATKCDALIISGGVSVGARDFVKTAITAAGGALDLWRVAVKPGKPFLYGHAQGRAIFGLPGNPVSTFMTFLLFVRPALLTMMGASPGQRGLPVSVAELGEEVVNEGERPHFLRGALRGGVFRAVGRQESHALFGLARANGLLLVQPGARLPAGARVEILGWE